MPEAAYSLSTHSAITPLWMGESYPKESNCTVCAPVAPLLGQPWKTQTPYGTQMNPG